MKPSFAAGSTATSKGMDIDDSSSVTSMSSSTRGKECFVCGKDKKAFANTKLLVQCITCRRAWHAYCHNPKILENKDWQCDRCSGKRLPSSSMRASTRSSPISPRIATSSDSEFSKFTQSKNPYACEIEGCQNPVFQSAPRPGIKLHCKRHETEERHKIAAAQKRPVIMSERPIKKKKLYPYKPDADMERTLKRKRDSLPKLMNSNSSIGRKEGTAPDRYMQKPWPARAEAIQNNLTLNGKSRHNIAIESAPEIATNFRYIPPPINTDKPISSSINAHDSARCLPAKKPVPGYAPVALPYNTAVSMTPRVDDSDSPGLQITQELRELVEKKSLDRGKAIQNHQSPQMDQILLNMPPETLEQQIHSQYLDDTNGQILQVAEEYTSESYQNLNGLTESTIHATTGNPKSIENEESGSNTDDLPNWADLSSHLDHTLLHQRQESQQIPLSRAQDIQPREIRKCTSSTVPILPQEGSLVLPPTPSPQDIPEKDLIVMSPTLPLSPSTTSNEMLLEEGLFRQIQYPISLEAKRQQMASTYDCTRLDSFLGTSDLVSYKELKDQEWGHIDPCTHWPPDISDTGEEGEEQAGHCATVPSVVGPKSKRKANFGKHLTRQVVLHREQEGWDIHQNKDVSGEKLAEGAALLEELFGIKDIDDLEPGSNGGKFGMKRKTSVVDERRKRSDYFYQLECG